jgi:hypothetical protein
MSSRLNQRLIRRSELIPNGQPIPLFTLLILPARLLTFSARYGFLLRWHRVSLGLGFELLVRDLISRPTPKQTLLLILLPMLGTVLCLRLYLHLVRVQHVYPGGYLVHHLFVGVLIELPAAFVLAFGARRRMVAFLALAALGVGSGMILDEVTYLVLTKASDLDYVSWVSLGGAIGLVTLATIGLGGIYWVRRD